MMIARWTVDARFGHKDAALDLMRGWWRQVAPEIGWTADQCRILSGSVGARESAIEVEVRVGSLADLEQAWARLGQARGHAAWAAELEPHIVSGTSQWTVYRVV